MKTAPKRPVDFFDPKKFWTKPSLTNPGWAVCRRAYGAIRERAELHFKGRLLEIGCGEKRMQMLLGDLVDEYIGLDHPGCIHDQSNVDVLASAYETTLASGSFDCVLSAAVIEHLEEPGAALREAARVLKPGGIALYTAPFFFHLHEEPRDFFRYTKHGLRHLFEQAGLEVIEITPLSSYWLTSLTQWSYYLQCVRRGPLKPFVRLAVACNNLVARLLDRVLPRDERFTWMYLVLARKPVRAQTSAA